MRRTRRLQAPEFLAGLTVHPRIAYQSFATGPEQLAQISQTAAPLLAFGKEQYFGALSVIDWDHRLPSEMAILRVFAFYAKAHLEAGQKDLAERTERIQAEDVFPEFDVSDYAELHADEIYEASVSADGTVSQLQLISSWRREMPLQQARRAVAIVRTSQEFEDLQRDLRDTRSDQLGDLEAVGWAPPCETSFERWMIDVWYLLTLDYAVGKGCSFLVDLELGRVAAVREFVVHAN